jgi:beta-lactamase regulating signal transducer with metallopeptidase domain
MPPSEVFVAFTDWLLKLTIDASFCILLILLVRRNFARFFGARLCRLLWIILFVRCLVPWSLPINVIPESLISEFNISFDSRPAAGNSFQPSEKINVRPGAVSDAELIADTQTALSRSNIFTAETLRVACVIFWFLGLLILLGLTVLRNRRIAHVAAKAPKPVPSWLQEIFLEYKERLKIRIWPVLVVSSDIDCPSLIGAVRPHILLPGDLVSRSNREQLHHILLHELTHLKQGDIWLSWFWTFVCSVQWFNPLVWCAGRYMYLDREMACDDRVLGVLESDKRIEYSRTLLDLFKKINLPARCPGLACVVERKTNIERRLGMITKFKIRSNRQIVLGSLVLFIIAAMSLASFAGSSQITKLSGEKAELMGRVEDFFMHNFRDVTARKSLQWGEPETDEKENRSIRYMYEAQIWEKDWKIMNQIFTFNKDGEFVDYKNVSGFPKDKEVVKVDTSTEEGMKALVEKFFSQNYRDITARKTIEWGKATTDANGNRSIRYKFEATIWDKDKEILNKVFTFTPEGEFVSVQDAVSDIELAKWNEGKAGAGTIATALRAYIAEHLPNIDYKNITIENLGLSQSDLQGKFFNFSNYQLSNISFDETRIDNPLHYTITVTRPDNSWQIKSIQLTQTGQWIQNP